MSYEQVKQKMLAKDPKKAEIYNNMTQETLDTSDGNVVIRHEDPKLTQAQVNRLTNAMFSDSFPVNPIPFAHGLADYVSDNGTKSIQSDEAKRILWVLMAQAYGQMGKLDLTDEWQRLHNVVAAQEGFGE